MSKRRLPKGGKFAGWSVFLLTHPSSCRGNFASLRTQTLAKGRFQRKAKICRLECLFGGFAGRLANKKARVFGPGFKKYYQSY
jgi:hypothetical protein